MFLAVINDVFERVGKEDIPDKFILAEFFNDVSFKRHPFFYS